MKEKEEKVQVLVANLVFAGLSVAQMDKIPKWLLQNIENNIPSFMNTLLETQALALEGMKKYVDPDHIKSGCLQTHNHDGFNEALQQAADAARASDAAYKKMSIKLLELLEEA